MSINTIMALLVFLTISEGILGDHGVNQRCRCISKEKRPIRRYIGKVEVHLASSHCQAIEIIATLKKDGQKICLDPDAPWVKRFFRGNRLRDEHLEVQTFTELPQMEKRPF